MKTQYILIIAILLAFFISPVMAGTKYMAGSPDLTATISGINEFSQGKDVTITVIVQNKGLNDIKMIQSTLASPADQPNTAKLTTVSLKSGPAPLAVKSDPQMVGDIMGGASIPVPFIARISSDAPPGEYLLPLELNYTYLDNAEQVGSDSIIYHYRQKTETFQLPVKIKPLVTLEVLNVDPEYLNAGNDGYLNLKIKNKGFEYGKNAVIKIVRDGSSPVVPVDSSVYIGDFSSNSTVNTRYKVTVTKDAGAKTYPVNMVVVYENRDGDTVTSDPVTVGVPVGGKVDLTLVSEPIIVYPGTNGVFDVEYENTGAATIYSAQARISTLDPFSSTDDVAFIGDMKPGDHATVQFQLSVAKTATKKEYGLDSEIRYRDALDNTHISDTMKVKIDVINRSGIGLVVSNPILVTIIIAGVIGVLYYVFFYRKRNTTQ
ncbi:MAG: S-layer protein [Methanomicrobiales archaeon]|nr:S-layer protein [Methanomicrobiales archaeon]